MRILPAVISLTCLSCALFYAQTSLSIASPRPAATASKTFRTAEAPAENGAAATPQIAGPTLGFVFDRDTAALRRVPGIPGAATIGDPLNAPIALANAYAAPQQDYAVGIAGSDQSVVLIQLSHGAVTDASALAWAAPAPDRVAFSPSGDSLVLYYRNDRKLIVVNQVPQSPQIAASWDLSSYQGDLTSLAVKDGGDVLLAGVTQTSGGVLLLFRKGVAPNVLLPMSHPSAAQFFWSSEDAVVADQAQSLVYLLKNVTGAIETRVLARPEDGLTGVDLLAVDRFARTVVAAHSGGPLGLVIDLSQSAAQIAPCQCAISALEPLNGDRFYRVSSLTNGQFFALDASASTPVFQSIGSSAACAGRLPARGEVIPLSPGAAPLPCRSPAGGEELQ